MELLDLSLVAAGALVLAIGSIAPRLHHWWAAEPAIAWIVGLALGGLWLGYADPFEFGSVTQLTEPFARITLVIGLIGVALRLPTRCFIANWRPILVLLGPVMLAMWGVSTLIAWLCLDIHIETAAVLGACLTPTDPVLASSIVAGPLAAERLPKRVRELISMESGLNDGLAMLFVTLAMTWLGGVADAELERWLWHDVLWEVACGTVVGLAAGGVVGWAIKSVWQGRLKPTEHLAFAMALGLLVLGAEGLFQMNGILGAFVAVVAMDGIIPEGDEGEITEIQETLELFFLLPIFAWLGAVAPYKDWGALGWSGVAFAVLVLLFRRIPALALFGLLSSPLRRRRRRLFIGWFGPVGIAAIFYATHVVEHAAPEIVWTATTLVVAASVFAHGISASPLTARYPSEDDDTGDGNRDEGRQGPRENDHHAATIHI